MFTGLIADLGGLVEIEQDADGAVLRISSRLADDLRTGDSVAVNGVCLTATRVGGGRFSVQAMNETLERSSLGRLSKGDKVNLELALRAKDRLGGHIVQGHVDGTTEILELHEEGFSRVMRLSLPDGLARYLVTKGSVAIDGVSLTISSLGEDWFEVSLIPETLERTNLGRLRPGAPVNIEVDVLAKHVERLLGARV